MKNKTILPTNNNCIKSPSYVSCLYICVNLSSNTHWGNRMRIIIITSGLLIADGGVNTQTPFIAQHLFMQQWNSAHALLRLGARAANQSHANTFRMVPGLWRFAQFGNEFVRIGHTNKRRGRSQPG